MKFMNMRKFLGDLITRKKTELKATELRFENSKDEAEVRALGETLQTLRDEISAAEEQLKKLDEDDNNNDKNNGDGTGEGDGSGEGRSAGVPQGAQLRNGVTVGQFTQPNGQPQERDKVSVLDSMEYRNAFANYVRTGETSAFAELEQRAASDGMVITSDVGKIIPNTIMDEFIKELKVYGNLYAKVRKLNIKGGVEFPIEELVPTVTWITETTVSENQSEPEFKTSISFGYHICEARIAQSLLSQVVSLAVLETEIARLLAEAFVKEFDRMIVSGSGSGQPLGILNDTRIDASHKITFTAAEIADWTKWRKKLFSIIPLAYRGEGVLVMTASTWENYIMTLKDANNNPLGTETFGVQNGDTVCRFAGKEVLLVEPDILNDFDTASTGDAWGIYFKPTDYAINSNLQIGFKRYFNDDTNKWVNKGLCILDGKMLDTHSCYILTK